MTVASVQDEVGPGVVFAGRYRLVSELGRGGMGAVWRAEHVTLGSPVAIKLLEPRLVNTAGMVERFMREARSAASLQSIHVVSVFDFGVEDHTPYIAMELLTGESLRERLDRQGKLGPAETVRLLTHVARAIQKAHDSGIVHRDLKPENVFLVRDDEEFAKVLDFGIAKIVGEVNDTSAGVATQTGTMLGTPYYMSPEQAQGTRAVDYRADLWAMGVVAYECLLGSRPFDSTALGDLVLRICSGPIPVPSEVGPVPPSFDAWFARAVARDPAARFASAQELVEALGQAFGEHVATNTPGPGEHAVPATSTTAAASAAGLAASAVIPKHRTPIWTLLAIGALILFAVGLPLAIRTATSGAEASDAPSAVSADTLANVGGPVPSSSTNLLPSPTPSASASSASTVPDRPPPPTRNTTAPPRPPGTPRAAPSPRPPQDLFDDIH